MKEYLLTQHDLNKLKEFFEPRLDQVQMFTSSTEVCKLLTDMGYKSTEESSDDLWYFRIPERFRNAVITRTVTEHKSW